MMQRASPDMFPSKRAVTQTDPHLVWKFVIKDWNLITLWVGYDGCEAKHLDLNLSYLPALACFDIEYWRTMLIPDTNQDRVVLLKAQWRQQYMRDLRRAISHEVYAVDGQTLQDGSWKMGTLHQWCIRTWNNYSHSEFGRNQYLSRCREKQIIPYAQELNNDGECSHFMPMSVITGYHIRLDKTFYKEC
jgi:hypothetical protein